MERLWRGWGTSDISASPNVQLRTKTLFRLLEGQEFITCGSQLSSCRFFQHLSALALYTPYSRTA
jgi:hypothetical protein